MSGRTELGPDDITGFYHLATFNVGNCYTEGRGVSRDLVKGIGLIREAADNGHVMATHRLGYLHENGVGVTRDVAKAMELYLQAAKYHFGQSETNIGWLIQSGNGVRKDLEAAAIGTAAALSACEPQAM